MLKIDNLRTALQRWSRDPILVQTLRAGWAVDLPAEIFAEALATGRGLAINVTSHKVLLQLRHGSQSFEFAIPIAALTDPAAYEKWLRAIRIRAEKHLEHEQISQFLRSENAEHWEPIPDR
jgi:hypothetical protein